MAGPAFTLDEAAGWLSPPISRKLLACLVSELGIEVAEFRSTGRPGHPFPAYETAEFIALHAALLPWLRRQA